MPDINWFAAAAAGIAGFFPGALWYSNLMFLRAWQVETGIIGASGERSKAFRIVTGVLLSLVAAILFAILLGPEPPLDRALVTALVVGAGFVTTSLAIQYLFEGRTLRLTLINGGYHIVQFAIFGLILGLWH